MASVVRVVVVFFSLFRRGTRRVGVAAFYGKVRVQTQVGAAGKELTVESLQDGGGGVTSMDPQSFVVAVTPSDLLKSILA